MIAPRWNRWFSSSSGSTQNLSASIEELQPQQTPDSWAEAVEFINKATTEEIAAIKGISLQVAEKLVQIRQDTPFTKDSLVTALTRQQQTSLEKHFA